MKTYLLIAFVVCYVDAVGCFVAGVKFRPQSSIPLSVIWPVSVPIEIYAITILTKNNPPTPYQWKRKDK